MERDPRQSRPCRMARFAGFASIHSKSALAANQRLHQAAVAAMPTTRTREVHRWIPHQEQPCGVQYFLLLLWILQDTVHLRGDTS